MAAKAWGVSPDPLKPAKAIAFFRDKVSIAKDAWTALSLAHRAKAFTVAGAAQLDVIAQVWKALDDAIDNGTTLKDFQDAIGPTLQSAWAGSVANPAWRVETIFRTNVQHAYAAGRYAQATDPDVLEVRPVWMFDAIMDGRTSKICADCDGTRRPADDKWWGDHHPPLHFNCRSSVITLTEEQAKAMGGNTESPKTPAQDGFGEHPKPNDWEPDLSKYPDELRKAYETKAKKAA